jgi:radical SAM protein with 4Fe4S-binding SPASM domain
VRHRVERFGAWVQLDDATLVALDRRLAARAGIDGGERWRDDPQSPHSLPLEVHVAITSRCPVACAGCYQDAGPTGEHAPRESLTRTLDTLAEAGVFTVAFGGGEPLAHEDLGALADEARARGMAPVVTTSGVGLREEHFSALSRFAQVNVSHDGTDGAYRAVRGFDGASVAERAIAALASRGISVGVNLVLTRESFDVLDETAARVRSLGARELQLLRYKPAGRAASLDYLDKRLSRAQGASLGPALERLSLAHGEALSIRVDCALVCFLAAHVRDARALERWGIFGCEAGRHLAATDLQGALRPCSFADATAGETLARWQDSRGLEPFRAFVAAPPEPCASCHARAACRGGCKVVSQHVDGAFGPDPECPRVLAHREGTQ